jgi:hypothetical protein
MRLTDRQHAAVTVSMVITFETGPQCEGVVPQFAGDQLNGLRPTPG